MGLGRRLAKLDDRAIYRRNDPEHRVRWGLLAVAAIVGTLVAGVLAAIAEAASNGEVASVGLFAVSVAFVVCYVFWRRARNKRLTGSPTEWPSN